MLWKEEKLMLEIRTFGGLQLTTGGQAITGLASRKAEALLVYLAVTGRPHSREILANLFWDERSQTQSMANLRTVLSSLRQNIGDYLEISRDYAGISPEAEVWLDLQEFEQQVGSADLEKAISIYQGDFLEGFFVRDCRGFEDWLHQERTRCQKRLQEGLHAWVRYHIERGSFQEGIDYAEHLLLIDPLDESALRQLLALLSLSGQQASLTKRYEDFCQLLESELGVEPSQQTREHYQSLLAGNLSQIQMVDIPILEVHQIRAVGDCPYRGLAHFREVDAPFFFGRETFADHLENAIGNGSGVAVILGASGAGKSSAVYAGLLPRLRQAGSWQIISLRPGRKPFTRLAAALIPFLDAGLSESKRMEAADNLAFEFRQDPGALGQTLATLSQQNGGQRILLLIDQFEELYTLCSQPELQRRFLDTLLRPVKSKTPGGQCPVMLLQTLRADFMGQALAYRPFADALQGATLMLGPMTREELQSVIVKPAEKQGAAFEPGLVERILNDVGEEPGNLPLLEFALTLLWERLDQGWFTHAAYEGIGHVAGALTRYAEEVFTELDEHEQEQIRRVFVQLVQPGEGAEDTRRIATREDLAGSDWSLIQHLADKRLVVTSIDQEGDQTVEVVHEALIRSWGRLGNWMEEDRAFRSWQEGLRGGIRQWQDNQEDEGGLLRGRPLAQAESWLAERPAELSKTDQSFIQASIDLRDHRERQRNLTRRRIVAGLVIGLVITLALSVFSFYQRNQSLEAYSMSLAAHVQNALDAHDTDTALALAIQANQIRNPPPEVQRVLRQAAYAPGPVKRLSVLDTLGHEGVIYSLEASPTKMIALIGMDDGALFLWDIQTGQVIYRLEGHTEVVRDMTFSPDGKTALSASHDGLVILWDLATGKQIRQFSGHTGWVWTVDFSPDGQTMVSGGFQGKSVNSIADPGELILWDVQTGKVIRRFGEYLSGVVAAEFSPDGHSILASSGLFVNFQNEYTLILWDVETGEVIHNFDTPADDFDLAISPDGKTAVSGAYTYEMMVWNLETGELTETLSGFDGIIRSVNFSPSGDKLLSSDANGDVILWDTHTWEKLMHAKIHVAGESGWSGLAPDVLVSIAADGRTGLSSAEDQTLAVRDLVGAVEIRRFSGHQNLVISAAFTPDGKSVLTGSGNLSTFAGVAGEHNDLRLWDLESGDELHLFEGHTDLIWVITVSADGKKALSGSFDGTLRLWDLENLKEIRTIQAHQGQIFAAAISPDGKTAVSGTMTTGQNPDDGIAVWNLGTGEALFRESTEVNATIVLFSPDGKTAYFDGNALAQFDMQEVEIITHFSELGLCCSGAALHPDGHSVFIVDNADTIIREWSLETNLLIRLIGEAHGGNHSRVEITPDGKRLFSSGTLGNLYLWDLATGEELYRFYSNEITADIDISPDGRYGISAGQNNTAILWNLDLPVEPDEVIAWIAANRYARQLTCEERATYSIEPLCD